MAKKGGVQQLQTEVNTDDELSKFLEREGLLVLDVFTDWCGPCLGMVGSLKKIKLELGGDDLHLAICKVDEISALKRFRNRSEPTWVFASKGKVVNLMFGANVPKLMKMIADELKIEKSFRAGEYERTFYALDELTPAEVERVKEKERLEEEATRAEQESIKKKRQDFITHITNEIMTNIRDHGVMLLMPQVPKDSFRRISESADPYGVSCKDKRIVKLMPENLEILHFECTNPLPDDVLEAIFGKELQAVAWKVSDQETKPVEEVLRSVHEALTVPQSVKTTNEAGEEVEVQLSPVLAAAEVDPPRKTPSPLLVLQDPKELLSEPKEVTKVLLPAAWTPYNRRANAALIYLFFRHLTEIFLPPDPVPDPPHLAIIFDAFKKQDIMDACLKHKTAVLAYGYFTSADPKTATLIANTNDAYAQVKRTVNDKLVLKVTKSETDAVLELVSLGPCFVSQNCVQGEVECAAFFPEGYTNREEGEGVEEEHVEVSKRGKKKKKKKKDEDTSSVQNGQEVPDIAALEEAIEEHEDEKVSNDGHEKDDDAAEG
ncbi:uncharacterized protein LOC129794667 [Lutzomyia longipalpis]|uniref:uncharacterized protein LOC129794667 n=1 Tax=Lutzomyia longipalpis TaxID=7200 RepID=UPI0024843FF2|nr:uncharacterized protein LOC129794667 [Lutzomyia longipalpis]